MSAGDSATADDREIQHETFFFSIQYSRTTNSQISAQRIFLSPARKRCQQLSKASPFMKERPAIFFRRASQKDRNSFFSQRSQGKRKPCFLRNTTSSGKSGFTDSTSRLLG